jgi:hypothetical protein
MSVRQQEFRQQPECRTDPANSEQENRNMDEEKDDKQQLPVSYENESDGFNQPDEANRIIVGLMEKFNDGEWTTGGLPADKKRRIVAVATNTIIQRWKDGETIETITEKPLPDVKLLNETVPREEWEIGINGPREPYQITHVVYLLNLDDAERTTFINSTVGAAIAVSRLKDKVVWMRRMRGENVFAQLDLTWAPMPTRFGMRKRPEFRIIGWIVLGPGGGALPPSSEQPKQLPPAAPKQDVGPRQTAPLAPKKVEEPSLAEELDDDIPF